MRSTEGSQQRPQELGVYSILSSSSPGSCFTVAGRRKRCSVLPAGLWMLSMSLHHFAGGATDSARLGNWRDFGCRGPSGLAAGPLGRGGCSTSCSACRARPGPAGPGLISLSHFPSFLLARRALTRCEIVANSTEYFKSSNAVMAARRSSKAGRELGWALTSPPPPPTH